LLLLLLLLHGVSESLLLLSLDFRHHLMGEKRNLFRLSACLPGCLAGWLLTVGGAILLDQVD
jgi:hypothetical protein